MHIIICGQSRSGSTLLYNLLRENVSNYQFYDDEKRALSVPDNCDQITKRPLDIFDYGKIKSDRECSFLITMRDPRDILTSVHTSVPDDYFCDYDKQYMVTANKIEKSVVGLIPFYEQINKVGEALIIKYEDIICYPDQLQIVLCKLFKFNYTGDFEDWGHKKVEIPDKLIKALNGIRPIDDKGIGRWRDHPERIKDQFAKCPQLFEIVKEFGYEEDDEWFKEL